MNGADLEGIVNGTPSALIAVAATGEVTYWNRAAEDIFGYRQEEAVGQQLRSLIAAPGTPDEQTPEPQGNGVSNSYETTHRRKDGSLIYVNTTARSIFGSSGEVQGCVYGKVDVTHLRVYRDAKFIESRYQDLLESTPDAIVIVNEIGRIIMVNRQAEVVFGYRRDELAGQALEVLLPERFRTTHVGHRAGYLSQSRVRPMGVGLEFLGGAGAARNSRSRSA